MNTSAPKVGIWWFHDGVFLCYSEPVDKAENAAGYINTSASHADYWEHLVKSHSGLAGLEYYDLPRGRVLKKKKEGRYYVYGTTGVIRQKHLREQLIKMFNLPSNSIFMREEHYDSQFCP